MDKRKGTKYKMKEGRKRKDNLPSVLGTCLPPFRISHVR